MSFVTADQAAIQVLSTINPRSIIENWEYCGLIYRDSLGRFNYTIPSRGAAERNRSNTSLAGIHAPQNAVEIGFYHTHGDYTLPGAWNPNTRTHQDRRATNLSEVPRVRNEFGHRMPLGDSFSGDDITAINSRGNGVSGYRGYLGTPSRIFYYFDLGDRNQSVLFRHSRPPLRN